MLLRNSDSSRIAYLSLKAFTLPPTKKFLLKKNYANQPLMNIGMLVSPHQVWTLHCLQLRQGTSLDEVEISSGQCHPDQQ